MKKVIFVGNVACGKTTLCQALNDMKIEYVKTQALQVIGSAIDTPGEYLEHRAFFQGLTVTAADADMVLFVQDASNERFMFSPGMASAFSVPVTGVVAKADLASEKQITQAKELLVLAGADPVFVTSAVTGEGMDALRAHLK